MLLTRGPPPSRRRFDRELADRASVAAAAADTRPSSVQVSRLEIIARSYTDRFVWCTTPGGIEINEFSFVEPMVPVVGNIALVMKPGFSGLAPYVTGQAKPGGGAVELPKAKLRSTATGVVTVGSNPKFDFNAAGGSVVYDTDFDGTNSMADRTLSRLYCRWPGSTASARSATSTRRPTAGASSTSS